jgi:hypothetical protein
MNAVTIQTELGPLEIHYETTPAEETTYFHAGYPGSFDVLKVFLGPHDITEELRARGLMEWIETCAREQLEDDAKDAREAYELRNVA